jgi:hypothetical protein
MKLKLVLLFCFQNILFAVLSQQCYVATLIEGFDSLCFETLELDTATIYKGEKFIIFRIGWADKNVQIWTNEGEHGHKVNSSYIKILPLEVAPKMAVNKKMLFSISCDEENIVLFEKYGIDICEMARLAANHDQSALQRIFMLIEFVENENSRKRDLILSDITWRIFHLYEDNEFSQFLKSLNKKLRNSIAKYLTSPHIPILDFKIHYLTPPPEPPPLTNTRTYFKTNFPKTWRIIKRKKFKYKGMSMTYE